MPIDPSIALGVRPVQFESPFNAMSQLAQMRNAENQNALAQYQLAAAQRSEASQNALSNAWRKAVNPETGQVDDKVLMSAMAESGLGSQIPAVMKTRREEQRSELESQKARSELVLKHQELSKGRLAQVRTPEDYLAWHEANHRDPVLNEYFKSIGVTPDQSRQQILTQLQQPDGFEDLMRRSALGLEKAMEQHVVTQDLNGSTRVLARFKYGGGPMTVVAGSEAQKTAPMAAPTVQERTDGKEKWSVKIDPNTGTETEVQGSRRKMQLTPYEQQQLDRQLRDSNGIAQVVTDQTGKVTLLSKTGQIITPVSESGAPATITGKPSATFEKTTNQRAELSRGLTTAISELTDATKNGGLIDQSTGSGLGHAWDVIERFFGRATEGDIASGKLKPIADLALKMVPRFEGPQSDKDTQSYKEAAGQLADPTLPSKIRKEAGKTVLRLMKDRKEQFVTQNMVDEGTSVSAPSAAPKVVDFGSL
ncbi:hypothetical protein UFOVP254_24 [uncultured Caudovirales phage]|uniref:Uncharacterized protein n=1 Tax=uncultured Caudovirales phage TaxID=2100421 RepID=A0A6J5L077_9CAUD|nr:hypothetical protein UFOVP76_29 [uncultured Caudovirales phage]CAB4132978.1 hypothetical protein UFOVP254_24 [uncultured Caudovirales phage]